VGRAALLEVRMARPWAIYCCDEDDPEGRAWPRRPPAVRRPPPKVRRPADRVSWRCQ